jgi:hypothetical protein
MPMGCTSTRNRLGRTSKLLHLPTESSQHMLRGGNFFSADQWRATPAPPAPHNHIQHKVLRISWRMDTSN